MGLRLSSSASKNAESFYFVQDFINPDTGKRTTRVYEKLGTLDSLYKQYSVSSRDQVIALLKQRLQRLKDDQKKEKEIVTMEVQLNELLPLNDPNTFNVSWLYLQKILSMLGLKDICKSISEDYKFSFSLADILSMLICTRILYPGSKRSSLEDSQKLLYFPKTELKHVYRALPVLADNRYQIESELYQRSKNIIRRDSSVLYFDCTNFYFEIEEEDDYRKYGHSKENRPNPIVQYGLFLDSSHIPVADICFEGNKNEVHSMPELENILEKDFGVSRFIVCADAALNSFENKLFNDHKANGAFIVTQPVRKLKKQLKEWVIKPDGWRISGHPGLWDISKLKDTININGRDIPIDRVTFYKDQWIISTKKNAQTGKKEKLEEHLIVSFSTKYKKYQKHIRDKKLARAEKMLSNPGKIGGHNQRDPRHFIKETAFTTESGEIAEEKHYEIDQDKVREEAKFDGFYAVTTDLEDRDIETVIDVNHQRWEIEECFEIMKSELETRPIFLSTKEGIEGHLLTCFIALTVYRILEQFLGSEYTCTEIFAALREMNALHDQGPYYKGAFTRTPLTDRLAEIFGYQFAYKTMNEKELKKFFRNANSEKITQFIKDQKSR